MKIRKELVNFIISKKVAEAERTQFFPLIGITYLFCVVIIPLMLNKYV